MEKQNSISATSSTEIYRYREIKNMNLDFLRRKVLALVYTQH